MIIKIKDKVIGEFVDNTFTKSVKASKHLFKVLDAWGMDSELFEKLLLPTNAKIVIIDTESKETYTTDAQTYKDKGLYFHFKNPAADHRKQIFLRRQDFNKTTI